MKTEEEQHIWNECSRLIANAIIYYNTLLLSRVYEQKLVSGDEDAIELMRRISPIAWQYINLFGTFEFSPDTSKLNIDALVGYKEPAAYGTGSIFAPTHEREYEYTRIPAFKSVYPFPLRPHICCRSSFAEMLEAKGKTGKKCRDRGKHLAKELRWIRSSRHG